MCDYGALFIDTENIYYLLKNNYENHESLVTEMVQRVIDKLKEDIDLQVILKRTYAPFSDDSFTVLADEFSLMGITPVHVFASQLKNSADLALSIDVMEVLLTRGDIDTFVIIGGDRDYIPIVSKVNERAKKLYVVAPQKSMSGDLKLVVGDRYIDPMSLFKTAELRVKTPPKPLKKTGPTKKTPNKSTKPPVDAPVDALDLSLLVIEMLRMIDRYNNKEIWIAPLYRHLTENRPELSRQDWKVLVKRLEKLGAFKITTHNRSDGNGTYSVGHLDETHPAVREILERSE